MAISITRQNSYSCIKSKKYNFNALRMMFAARRKAERSNYSSALKAHCARNTYNIFFTNIAKYLIQLNLLRRYSKTGSKLYTIEY